LRPAHIPGDDPASLFGPLREAAQNKGQRILPAISAFYGILIQMFFAAMRRRTSTRAMPSMKR
jgi:hypothetical protein